MRRRSALSGLHLVVAALLAMAAQTSLGDVVGPPLSLDKLTAAADVVFKGAFVSDKPVQDAALPQVLGYRARETEFRVVSVLKGIDVPVSTRFRHYEEDPGARGRMIEPPNYRFEMGRAYVVFAKHGAAQGGPFLPAMGSRTARNQGVFLCAGAGPVIGKTVREVVWNELALMLKSLQAGDVVYAIQRLDEMSAAVGSFDGTADFKRSDVLAGVHRLISDPNFDISSAALALVGSHNPYLSEERELYWLTTVGAVPSPGIGAMDPKFNNEGGKLYRHDLISLADSRAAEPVRALAIRALGLTRDPAVTSGISRWLVDPGTEVRASATILLADFPGPESSRRIDGMTRDKATVVRIAAAHAAGFTQSAGLVPALTALLRDKDPRVRDAAAMSLLSYSPKAVVVADTFRANLDNTEFWPLFLNALARGNPAPFLDRLAEAVERQTSPPRFWGGQIPAFTSWEILFKHLQAQPVAALRSGKLDRYLDALEKVGNYSSSEPRDIYALYLRSGLTQRARRYRLAAAKAAGYDLDYFFKQADANPAAFRRE